jgi:hypothetical protein
LVVPRDPLLAKNNADETSMRCWTRRTGSATLGFGDKFAEDRALTIFAAPVKIAP